MIQWLIGGAVSLIKYYFLFFLSEWLLLPSVFVFKRNIDVALSENYFDRLQGVQDIETSCENYKKCNKFSNKTDIRTKLSILVIKIYK